VRRERLIGYNFPHVNIKVRSCRQHGSSRDHSRRVGEGATLNNYLIVAFGPTNDTSSTSKTAPYA
jgi:hypothetical protein